MKFFPTIVFDWYRKAVRNPKSRWFVVLATLAYLIIPTDFAPDFLPILGQIDDAMIVSLLLAELSPMLVDQIKARRAKAAQPKDTADASTAA